MVHMTVDHGVSGCFGTRLAPGEGEGSYTIARRHEETGEVDDHRIQPLAVRGINGPSYLSFFLGCMMSDITSSWRRAIP